MGAGLERKVHSQLVNCYARAGAFIISTFFFCVNVRFGGMSGVKMNLIVRLLEYHLIIPVPLIGGASRPDTHGCSDRPLPRRAQGSSLLSSTSPRFFISSSLLLSHRFPRPGLYHDRCQFQVLRESAFLSPSLSLLTTPTIHGLLRIITTTFPSRATPPQKDEKK